MTDLESITTRLTFSEEHARLREQVRRWLEERSPMDHVRALLADARGDDPGRWSEIASMGWLGLRVPEEHGGAGLGAVELAVLAEESGRRLLPSPVIAHVLATEIVVRGGSDAQRARLLPRLAKGELRATWAPVEPSGEWRVSATGVEMREGRLHGAKGFVWAAPSADLFLVPVRVGGEVRIAVVLREAEALEVEAEETLDRTRRQGRLRLGGVPVPPDDLLDRAAAAVEVEWLPVAWTALAAESIGGASAALDLTASYAATREQFGKPIGSFQAIKHPLVNVLVAVEQARSLVYAAACALDQGAREATLLARMAKAASDDAYGFATSRAIQFHGGFGFTEECDAHLYRRRALATRPAWGDADHHRRAIADEILGA